MSGHGDRVTLPPEFVAACLEAHEQNVTVHMPMPTYRMRVPKGDRGRVELKVGDLVAFLSNRRRLWRVKAQTADFTLVTSHDNDGAQYVVIAWGEGRRGPHGSWGHGAETLAQCQASVEALQSGAIHMSERGALMLDLFAVYRDPNLVE